MPWSQVTPMDERKRFVEEWERSAASHAELCRRFGVSRRTGYKWLDRYREQGEVGLQDRSRRPTHSPDRTPDHVVSALLEARRRHPTWGASKLLWLVERQHPRWQLPARSTVCALLKRHGMITPRRRTKRPHPGRPMTEPSRPNEIWAADFKGEFKTRDGVYCYPLTVSDTFSRFVLGCRGLGSVAHEGAQPRFVRLFREYGMPDVIRTDNGVPFATSAIARLSRLSVWWIQLGIRPETIEPGKPQQNGRHERMHRTLKAETARPPAANHRAQQKRFDRWRREFNHDRPHEALNQRPPASVYRASRLSYPETTPEVEYPGHFEVRRVWSTGAIRWRNAAVPVSHVLARQPIGLEEVGDGLWSIYFGPVELGRLDERIMKVRDLRGRTSRR